uniref:Uncharacterized protein n=1 Tax=Panstrongylus lignarius TaxID=156445 RepID=A0A224Y3T6_9HEMI
MTILERWRFNGYKTWITTLFITFIIFTAISVSIASPRIKNATVCFLALKLPWLTSSFLTISFIGMVRTIIFPITYP